VGWFDSYSVIMVSNLDSLNQNIGSSGVDTICVQRVSRDIHGILATKTEDLIKRKLAPHVDIDLHIVEIQAVTVVLLQVPRWGIHPFNSGVLNVTTVLQSVEVRSAIDVFLEVLSVPPHEALAINDTSTSPQQVVHFLEDNQI